MSNADVEMDKELEEVLGSHKTRIRIVGTGGGGNNTVTRLLEVGIKEVEVVAVNTDAQDLLYAKADRKLLIGRDMTNGLGAGSDPVRGSDAARESIMELEEILSGSDLVFVTCGLGGGTGTGSAPVIAEAAKKVGALTVAIVTLPFSDEGVVRHNNAQKGLQELHQTVDTVIVVQNDRLLDLVPDMPLNKAFKVADEILVNAVKGITELVTEKGLVNLDFADVRTIMENGGLAMVGLGESDTDDGAEEAAKKALQNPLLEVDITGARSALINITGGQEMSLKSAKTVMHCVAEKLDPNARIIWGARIDESMGQSMRVMLIVTFLQGKGFTASEIDMVLQHTDSPKETEPEPVESEVTVTDVAEEGAEKTTGRSNRLFSEIFIEESEADILVLEEAVSQLHVGEAEENYPHLRQIKNASATLSNSSDLFADTRISRLMQNVEAVTKAVMDDRFEVSEGICEIISEVPKVFRKMLSGDTEAYERADVINEKLTQLQEKSDSDGGDGNKGEQDAVDDENRTDFDDVEEAVNHFDKMFK